MMPTITRRRAALLLPLLAAACATSETAPPLPPAPGYDYLTPLRLNVLDIEVVEPSPMGVNFRVDQPAPLSPITQAVRMGRERLVPVGTTGRARFIVDAATLTREQATAGGMFAQQSDRFSVFAHVRVEIMNGSGNRVAFTEAEVRRNATVITEGPNSRARAADQIVRQAMDDLNVEFEFQIRRNLRDWIMAGDPGVVPAVNVQQENLGAASSPTPR